MILELISLFLFLIALEGAVLVLQGVRNMAVLDDILAAQSQMSATLDIIAAQKAASLTAEQAALILANETANVGKAVAIVTPT